MLARLLAPARVVTLALRDVVRGPDEAIASGLTLPDASALGDERAEPLYTVVFDAAELWAEAAGRSERVYIDLWQSYLEPA